MANNEQINVGINLTSNVSGFVAGIASAASAAERFEQALGAIPSGATVLSSVLPQAAATTGAALNGVAQGAANAAASLDKVGVSGKSIVVELPHAAELADTALSDLAQGAANAAAALDKVGVSGKSIVVELPHAVEAADTALSDLAQGATHAANSINNVGTSGKSIGVVLPQAIKAADTALKEVSQEASDATSALGKFGTAGKKIGEEVPAGTAPAGKAFQQMQQQAEKAATGVANAAKLTRQESLTLSYTMSDIVASLSSGASPMTILMQQGGQVKDAFGGLGPMFSKLAAQLTPVRLAVGGVAAAIGGVAYAMYSGAAQAKAFNDSMRLTGNFAGVTRGQFDELASTLSGRLNTTIGSARETLQAVVSSGSFTSRQLNGVAEAVSRVSDATGQSADEIVADFGSMSKGVAKWAQEHNQSYHFLTMAQYEYLRKLEEQGKTQQAQQVVLDALNGSLKSNQQILGFFPWLFNEASKSASGFVGWLAKIGAPQTGEDMAKGVEARLATLRRQLASVQRDNADVAAGKFYGAGNTLMSAKEQKELETEIATLEKKLAEVRGSVRDEQNRIQAAADKKAADAAAMAASEAWKKAYQTDAQQRKEAIAKLAVMRDQQLAAVKGDHEKELEITRDYKSKLAKLNETFDKREKKGNDEDVLADWKRRVEVLKEDGKETGKLSEAQKAYAALQADLADGHVKLTKATRDKVEALAKEAIAQEAANHAADKAQQLAKQELEKISNETNNAREKADAMQREVDAYGMDEGAVARMLAARAEDRAALLAAGPLHDDITAKLQAQARAYRDLGDAAEQKAKKEESTKAAKDLEDGFKSLQGKIDTSALKNSFSGLGAPLSGVIDKFNTLLELQDDFGKQSKLIAAAMRGTDKERETAYKAQGKLIKDNAKASMGGYADIAGAMKSMFKEHDRGYQAMDAAEKVFRAAQMAMTIASAAQQIATFTSVALAKQTADDAVILSAGRAAAARIAAEQAEGQAAAITGIANQGKGDPYTAFARIAAMAAVMAALGFATGAFGSSGGSGVSAAERQKETGTGTVLGDASAKSESISKAMEALKDIDALTMRYSAQMAASLKNIESNIGGLASIIVRTTGLSSGNPFDVAEGTIAVNKGDPIMNMLGIGKLQDALSAPLGGLSNIPILGNLLDTIQGFWGKTKQEIVDSGVLIAKETVADLAAGKGYSQYATVETTKSSFWGLKKDKSSQELTGELDGGVTRQFGLVFAQLETTLKAAAGSLGLDAAAIALKVENFELDMQRISLRDLNGEQIKEAITNAFSAAFDKVAEGVMAGYEDFQKVGEGYYETIIRLASGVEQANYYTERLNIATAALSAVENKQGDVAAELVRVSIEAAEGASNIGKMVAVLDGSASDIASAYTSLVDVQKAMRDITQSSAELSTGLLRAAGGLDNLASEQSDFLDTYYTDQEKAAKASAKVATELKALGYSMPTTKAGFRAIVESLDLTTEAGQKAYAKLMQIAPEFSTVADAADKAASDAGQSNYAMWQAQLKAAKDALATWDGAAASSAQLKAINADRYATEQALIKEIADTAKSVHDSATQSVRDLRYSVLDSAGKYDFLDKEIAQQFEELSKATDPTKIKEYFDSINQEINDAINLVPDDQKKQKVDEYIALIEKADNLSQQRLKDTQATIADQNAALATSITKSIVDGMAQAGGVYIQAADTMLKAAATPIDLNVSLEVETAGVSVSSEVGYSRGAA